MFLIVTRNFPPEIGGIQTLIGGLSESLLDHGPVKVFAYEYPNSSAFDSKSLMKIERVKGIKIFRKYRKANLVNSFIENNTNIRAIITDHWKSLELIKKENIEKVKTFCLLHSKEINHPKGSLINKRLLKSVNSANFVIANSNYTKELAIKIGIDKSKIHIIFPGIYKPKNVDSITKIKADELFNDAFPKIITVSRLVKRKGHDKILMLIKNLKPKFPKIKYISIGFGEEENNLFKLRKELSLEKEVIFLKNIDQNIKNALVQKADLFLMPTRIDKKSIEGFGISFVESGSYGTGSIGGKDGGSSDAIVHDKTGLLCDGNDLNSIYESVNEFLKDKNYIKFGKAAKTYSEDFYWSLIIKKYLNLIN